MRPRMTRHLRRLVPVHEGDGAGGVRRSWVQRGAFWAEVRARAGGVAVTEIGTDSKLRVRITVHAVPADHPNRPAQGDRFHETGRVYEVEAVHEADAAGRYLTCYAAEVAGGAST